MANPFGLIHELTTIENQVTKHVNTASSHIHNLISGIEGGHVKDVNECLALLNGAQEALQKVVK